MAFILICIVIPKDETGESSASEKVSKVEEASGSISESIEGDVACVDLLKKKWAYTKTRRVKNKFTNKYEKEEKTYTIGDGMTFLHKQVKIFAATWDKYYSPEGFLEGLKSGKLERVDGEFDTYVPSATGFVKDYYSIDYYSHRDGKHHCAKDGSINSNHYYERGHELKLWRMNIGSRGGVVTGVDFKWEVTDSEIPGVKRVSLYAEFSGYIWCSPQIPKDKPAPEGFKFNDVIFDTPPKVSVSKTPSIEERENGYTSAIVYGRRTLKWKRLLISALVDRLTGEVNEERGKLGGVISTHFRGGYKGLSLPGSFSLHVFNDDGCSMRRATIVE